MGVVVIGADTPGAPLPEEERGDEAEGGLEVSERGPGSAPLTDDEAHEEGESPDGPPGTDPSPGEAVH